MKKLKIDYKDGGKMIIKMKDSIDPLIYMNKYAGNRAVVDSAILQQYPKKLHKPVNMLEVQNE